MPVVVVSVVVVDDVLFLVFVLVVSVYLSFALALLFLNASMPLLICIKYSRIHKNAFNVFALFNSITTDGPMDRRTDGQSLFKLRVRTLIVGKTLKGKKRADLESQSQLF